MRLVPLLAALLLPGVPAAHEFWIAPHAYQVAPGEAIVADLRNGERFSGRALSLIPSRAERFEIVRGDTALSVGGRIGDRPALDMAAPEEGLWIVVHETGDTTITYDEMDRFRRFAEHKGFPGVVAEHEARGLGLPLRERYRRYAKSLVAVGDGEGSDRALGLRAELIALANPYTAGSGDLPVELRDDGAPVAGHQVEVFVRRGEDVTVRALTTDAEGRAVVALKPGTTVMLDAVLIEPLDARGDGPAWMTHWANLTFAVP